MSEQKIEVTLRVKEPMSGLARYLPEDKIIEISLRNCAAVSAYTGETFAELVKDTLVHELLHGVQEAFGQLFDERVIMEALNDPSEIRVTDDDIEAEEWRLEQEQIFLDKIKALEEENERLRAQEAVT